MEGPAAASAVNRETVAAIIPGYCEEKHVGDVVARTLQQIAHVLVVDDGSSDATAANARAAGAEVVVHEKNLGKGESIKTGCVTGWSAGFTTLSSLMPMGSIYRKRSTDSWRPPLWARSCSWARA